MTRRGRYGDYSQRQLDNARKSAGAHATKRAHQPRPEIDWDAAIKRCRAMLNETCPDESQDASRPLSATLSHKQQPPR